MNQHTSSTIDHGQPAPPPVTPQRPDVGGPERPRSSRRGWVWFIIVVLVAAGAYYFVSHSKQAQGPAEKGAGTAEKTGAAGGGRGRGRAMGVPPVVAVKAQKGNIGVYFTGLGAVTPIYTVSVKSRVDGQLMKVFYQEGQMVKEGDPLVEIDPRPYQVQLEQAEAQQLRDQALLENSKVDLTRYEQLITRHAIPEQTLATQRATVSQNLATIKTDQAAINAAKLNLVYTRINAPISGRVGLRLVDPGNYVQAASSTPLAVITQVDPISVIFTLPEDQLSQVVERYQHGSKLRVVAFDRELTHQLAEGYLSTIDNQIDQTTGTVKLRATFDNRGGKLFPNQFINARLLVQQKQGVTLLDSAAIQRNSQSTYVYVVKDDSTVTIRNVTLGTTDGDNTEITSGLEPGETVVMTGVDRLVEGSKVQVHMADETGQVPVRRAGGARGAGEAGSKPQQQQRAPGGKAAAGAEGGTRRSE